jgi:pyrroloquinoline quinone biosynthesis protein B
LEAILLGVAQDAGVPQAGCYCIHCRQARRTPVRRQFAACLGLVDRATRRSWLIDATPDFKEQLHLLHQFAPNCTLAGILLTHLHMGHYTGLVYLGPEAMNAQEISLYVTELAATFLHENAPWSHLVAGGHLRPRKLTPNAELALTPTLQLLPLPVPHRSEFSDAVAFVIHGPARRLFYCPDIDTWDTWPHNLRNFVASVDVALLDATFYSPDELPGRDLSKIPHPLATDTAARLAGVECEVRLFHLNHSNPLLSNGPELAWLHERGLDVGQQGQHWALD